MCRSKEKRQIVTSDILDTDVYVFGRWQLDTSVEPFTHIPGKHISG